MPTETHIQRWSANWHMEEFYRSPHGTHVAVEDHVASHAYDEEKERELFEQATQIDDGIYWSAAHQAYRSLNGRAVERSDALDATLRLQGWLKCAKSRSIAVEAE